MHVLVVVAVYSMHQVNIIWLFHRLELQLIRQKSINSLNLLCYRTKNTKSDSQNWKLNLNDVHSTEKSNKKTILLCDTIKLKAGIILRVLVEHEVWQINWNLPKCRQIISTAILFLILCSVVHDRDIYFSGLYSSPVVENIQKKTEKNIIKIS